MDGLDRDLQVQNNKNFEKKKRTAKKTRENHVI